MEDGFCSVSGYLRPVVLESVGLLLSHVLAPVHLLLHPLPHVKAGHRGQRERHRSKDRRTHGVGHGASDGEAGLIDKDGLSAHGHAAHHCHRGQGLRQVGRGHTRRSHAHLRQADLAVGLSRGRSRCNGLRRLGFVHSRGFG